MARLTLWEIGGGSLFLVELFWEHLLKYDLGAFSSSLFEKGKARKSSPRQLVVPIPTLDLRSSLERDTWLAWTLIFSTVTKWLNQKGD